MIAKEICLNKKEIIKEAIGSSRKKKEQQNNIKNISK